MKIIVKENYHLILFVVIIILFLFIASIKVKVINNEQVQFNNRYRLLVNK